MAKLKITSNPYEREISYCSFDEVTGIWLSSDKVNTDGYLRAVEYKRSFLPFKIKEIIDLIVSEYGAAGEIIEIAFEGTSEEYDEVEKVCNSSEYAGKVSLFQADTYLENARSILADTKELPESVKFLVL